MISPVAYQPPTPKLASGPDLTSKPNRLQSVRGPRPPAPTTKFERLLLAALILPLPLENLLPTIGDRTISLYIFVMAAAFVVVMRLPLLLHPLRHPVISSCLVLHLVCALLEFTNNDPSFTYHIVPNLRMILSVPVIAVLARDARALHVGLACFAIIGAVLGGELYRTGGQILYESEATSFYDASVVREAALRDTTLWGDINRISFINAIGAIVGFTFGISHPKRKLRWLYLALGGASLLATLFTASRTGIVIAVAGILGVIFLQQRTKSHIWLWAGAVLLFMLIAAPEASLARMRFGEVDHRNRHEGRFMVYSSVIMSGRDYIVKGVGENEYWNSWAYENIGNRVGSHNIVFQTTILWGFAATLLLFYWFYQIFRALPRPPTQHWLALCTWGVIPALGLRLLTTHSLYNKEFSIILGLLVAGHVWIWPKRRRPAAVPIHRATRMPPPAR